MTDLFSQCDLHVHTYFSPCGHSEMIPDAILQTVKRRGIRYLGTTDHLHANTDIDAMLAVRDEFHSTDGVHFFFGCEVDIDGIGLTPATPEVAEEFDFIVVGPTHFQHGFGLQPSSYDADVVASYMPDLFNYSIGLGFADVVAHPFMIAPGSQFSTRSQDLLTDRRLAPSLDLARERGVAMEISRRALVPDQREFYIRFYKLCKKIGLRFSIGSDAHALADAGQIGILAPLIREIEVTDRDIWLPDRACKCDL